VVYAVVALAVHVPVTLPTLILFIPAVMVYSVAAIGVTLGLSVLGARFRDLNPAISSIMILVFLITPIFWQRSGMAPSKAWLVDYNPFYHLIEIGRRPLLGQFAAPIDWVVSASIAAGLLLAGSLVFMNMRRKIYYWI